MESAVTAPVSGHIKRVVVQEGERLVTEQTPKCCANADYVRRFNKPRRPDYRNCALEDCGLVFVGNSGIVVPHGTEHSSLWASTPTLSHAPEEGPSYLSVVVKCVSKSCVISKMQACSLPVSDRTSGAFCEASLEA
jgi:hypothetical protein